MVLPLIAAGVMLAGAGAQAYGAKRAGKRSAAQEAEMQRLYDAYVKREQGRMDQVAGDQWRLTGESQDAMRSYLGAVGASYDQGRDAQSSYMDAMQGVSTPTFSPGFNGAGANANFTKAHGAYPTNQYLQALGNQEYERAVASSRANAGGDYQTTLTDLNRQGSTNRQLTDLASAKDRTQYGQQMGQMQLQANTPDKTAEYLGMLGGLLNMGGSAMMGGAAGSPRVQPGQMGSWLNWAMQTNKGAAA